MILRAVYDGGADPFEGTRELALRGLPADARVVAARATVAPVDPSGGRDPFAEEIRFPATASGPAAVGDWGATQVRAAGFAEIDFHARRTLAGFSGSDLGGASLQVDLGGGFVTVADQGGFAPPGTALSLADGGPVPGVAASRVRIVRAGSSPAVAAVRIRSLPTNVTLALAGRPALFFQAGELGVARTTPDFGALLAGFLAEGAEVVDGVYRLPFVLRSDAIARLRVELEIEYLRTASILPAGLPEAKLAYDLATVPRAGSAALEVALPAAAVPVAAASPGRVVGPFGDTRIAWGPSGERAVEAAGTVAVSPAQSAAQPLALPDRPEGYEVVAVDLRLAAVDRKAKLALDLRADDSGKPGMDSLLAAPVPFELARGADGGEAWLAVELARPLTLKSAAERAAWLLLQSAEGEAAWSVAVAPVAAAGSGAVPLQASADGGFSYRAAALAGTSAPLAASFRLRERPAGFRMPLSAELGTGAEAVRVDLSRLSPFGKVAFDLSIPEIAAGIAVALEKARGGGEGSGGELLADPAFAHWAVEGDEIGAPRPIPLGPEPAGFVAFAPDGRIALGALADPRSQESLLVAWDTEILAEAWRLALDLGANAGGGPPAGLAVDPAGRFAYLLLRNRLAVVDLAARRLLGAPIALADGPFATSALAISDDGAQLAVAGLADGEDEVGPKAALFDAEQLVDLVREGAATAVRARTLDLAGDPVALAFSAGGARLYALAGGPEVVGLAGVGPTGTLTAYDLRSSASPVQVPFDGTPVALAVAGPSILVLHPARLDRYEAATLAPSGSLALGQGLRALAVEPGGRRALLVGASGLTAVALAPAAMSVVAPTPVVGASAGVAVSPLGDRAVVAPLAATGAAPSLRLQVIPLGTPRPLDWRATAGRVRPFSLSGGAGRGVVLGEEASRLASQNRPAPPGPSALSQVVAAISGRTYELSFQGAAEGEARAEVLWRAVSGATSGTIETVALPIEPRTAGAAGEPSLHRGRFAAPSGTIAAEIRFVAEEGLALVRDASFREPENALEHGDLLDPEGTTWVRQPPAAPGFRVAASRDGGTLVSNAGGAPVVLRQKVAAEPGTPFELRLRARREAGPPARVDLRFLAADGTQLGAPVGLAIPAYGFDAALALGAVPAAAARAEVAVAVPAGSSVRVEAIELRPVPRVRLPLTFLAEAPGELSVIGGAIAWDLAATNGAAPPPRPAPGSPPLPEPTPPPGAPGEDECGCDDDAHPAAAPPPVPALAVEPIDPIVIVGIGPRRAEVLRAHGIATVQALLYADPRELARILPTVSERMAVDFVRQARVLVDVGRQAGAV